MKNYLIIILSIFLLVSIDMFPQQHRFRGDGKGREKLMELEKVKLLDELDLSEENSIKFITRLKDHRNRMDDFMKQQNDMIDQMESQLNNKDGNYKKNIDNYLEIDSKMNKERENFISSISDILTDSQIVKYLVFERRFREEVRGVLMRERMRRENK
ncbi:MAG: hypothetical protein ACM3O3_01060 [Syntrophothermus sp.]